MKRNPNPISLRLLLVAAPAVIALAGCHWVVGPHEGRQEWWWFCDASGCYRCDAFGCEVPDSFCSTTAECPSGMFCDPYDAVCKSKQECTTSAQCGNGYVCTTGKCIPARLPCESHAACGDGAYCSNGACKNTGKCTKDTECTKWGSSFVCDPRGTCVPGTPPVASCQTGSGCPDGLCVDAQCAACAGDCGGGKSCQFNLHCGDGRVCLDGQCTASCTTSADCGSGQTCKSKVCVNGGTTFCLKNSDCGAGKLCVNNACFEDCTTSGKCTNVKDWCSSAIAIGTGTVKTTVKACAPDHDAQLQCTVNKDCTGGEVCVNGVCRTSCTKDADCVACPDGPVCGKGGFCMTAAEASPQCTTNAQCTGGAVCLNTQCVTL